MARDTHLACEADEDGEYVGIQTGQLVVWCCPAVLISTSRLFDQQRKLSDRRIGLLCMDQSFTTRHTTASLSSTVHKKLSVLLSIDAAIHKALVLMQRGEYLPILLKISSQ